MAKKIAVLGSNGYLGAHLCKSIDAKGIAYDAYDIQAESLFGVKGDYHYSLPRQMLSAV